MTIDVRTKELAALIAGAYAGLVSDRIASLTPETQVV